MFLALRELKYAKMRYLLIGFIMVLISLLVLFVSGLAKGLSSDNASSIQKMNADYFVLQKDSQNRLNRSVLSKEQVNNIEKLTKDHPSTPFGIQMTNITKNGSSTKIDVTMFAIDVKGMLAPPIVEGKMIDSSTSNAVIADQSLKENGLTLGDQIEDQITGKTYKISGFTSGQSFSHSPVIYMNIKEWEATNKPLNAIALQSPDPIAKKELSGVNVISKTEALKGIPGYQEEQGSLMMMIAFLFVIAAFVLAVFFYVITIQKMNQFGVLKAIGAKSSYLARNIMSQVLALSIVSLVISIGLTYGISLVLPSSMPFDLSPQLVATCSGLFLAVSVIGSLLSLYQVAKIDALEAIGRAA